MKMPPPGCESDRLEDLLPGKLKPVVNRGAPEGRRRCYGDELCFLLLSGDYAHRIVVAIMERVNDVARSDQCRYQLAAEQLGIWRQCTQYVCVHDVHQRFPSPMVVPTNVLVACSLIEYRIAESKYAHQFLMCAVPDQKAHSPAVAIGNRNLPIQGGKPKQIRLPSFFVDKLQLRVDCRRNDIFAVRKPLDQIGLVPMQPSPIRF